MGHLYTATKPETMDSTPQPLPSGETSATFAGYARRADGLALLLDIKGGGRLRVALGADCLKRMGTPAEVYETDFQSSVSGGMPASGNSTASSSATASGEAMCETCRTSPKNPAQPDGNREMENSPSDD